MNKTLTLRAQKLRDYDIEKTDLKKFFGYSDNYKLLIDLLDSVLFQLSTFNTSAHKNVKNMFTLICCVDKLLYLEYTPKTSPVYYKIKAVLEILDQELSKNHRESVKKFLNKLKNKALNTLSILDDENYESKVLNKKDINNNDIYNFIDNILFEIKDIKLITKFCDKKFIEAIASNMDKIVEKLCHEYLNSDDKEYYYELFIYLSSKEEYGLDKYIDYITKCFKFHILNKRINNDRIYNNEVNEMDDIINKISEKDINKKYEIPVKKDFKTLEVKYNNSISDMRDKYTFTIDPSGADCLDDAISFEKLNDDEFKVGVYIADLSDIIKPFDDIDKYAYSLAESLYRGEKISMLPEYIYSMSSLFKGVDRLVHAYIFYVDGDYNIKQVETSKAIIRVKDNFSYQQVDKMIYKGENPFDDDLRKLYNFSDYLLSSNESRKKYILNKEALNPERKFQEKYGNSPSSKIVSELKVLTNSYLALNAYKFNVPFIYRNNLSVENNINKEILDEFDIKSILTSSFKSSYYSDENLGHHGLNLAAYAHATTPLRNYAALFNQRMINNYMLDYDIKNADIWLMKMVSKDLAKYLNRRIVLNKMYVAEMSAKSKILTK